MFERVSIYEWVRYFQFLMLLVQLQNFSVALAFSKKVTWPPLCGLKIKRKVWLNLNLLPQHQNMVVILNFLLHDSWSWRKNSAASLAWSKMMQSQKTTRSNTVECMPLTTHLTLIGYGIAYCSEYWLLIDITITRTSIVRNHGLSIKSSIVNRSIFYFLWRAGDADHIFPKSSCGWEQYNNSVFGLLLFVKIRWIEPLMVNLQSPEGMHFELFRDPLVFFSFFCHIFLWPNWSGKSSILKINCLFLLEAKTMDGAVLNDSWPLDQNYITPLSSISFAACRLHVI